MGGMVPRCRGGVLATPWAPPSVARGVSAALRLRTAVPALLVVGAGWAPGLLLFSTVFRGPRDALVLLADGRACVRASVALFATDALARDWLLVVGPARVVVGGVLSGDLLLSPPLPPNVGVSSAESGEGRGGPRIGLDAPLFSRGTLLDLRLRVMLLDPAELVVVGGVTEVLPEDGLASPDGLRGDLRASLDAGGGLFRLVAPRFNVSLPCRCGCALRPVVAAADALPAAALLDKMAAVPPVTAADDDGADDGAAADGDDLRVDGPAAVTAAYEGDVLVAGGVGDAVVAGGGADLDAGAVKRNLGCRESDVRLRDDAPTDADDDEAEPAADLARAPVDPPEELLFFALLAPSVLRPVLPRGVACSFS